jgi:hypothetical protein
VSSRRIAAARDELADGRPALAGRRATGAIVALHELMRADCAAGPLKHRDSRDSTEGNTGHLSTRAALRFRRPTLNVKAASAHSLLVILALFFGGCGERSRNVIEVVTRGGATFTVVEPQANYERVCMDGQYPLNGDPDTQGLRATSADADNPDKPHSHDEIPWAAIDAISFAEPTGDISKDLGGSFCPGRPISIAATIHLKGGATQSKNLIDTTDLGIRGKNERGTVVIPIREIASLKTIADQNWPWAKAGDHLITNSELPTLRVTTTSGATREFWAPSTGINNNKYYGKYILSPPDHTPDGLPALIAGARAAIPWNMIKQVDIAGNRLPLPGQTQARLAAHIVYADGHGEDVGVADGGVVTTKNGGDSIDFRDIVHIELAPSSMSNR